MKLLGKNKPNRDSLGDVLQKAKKEYTEKEIRRDIENNAVFVIEYEKDGVKRVAIELMELVNMDDPWFQSYVWALEEGETYDHEKLWQIMKSEIEEQRREAK